MKFNARVAAAIDCLDQIGAGQSAGSVLSHWGRAHRFAGSGDRNAIRDLVFDALRCKRSFGRLGGSLSGRGLMMGWCLNAGLDPSEVFTGLAYAPDPLTQDESACLKAQPDLSFGERLDWPEWLLAEAENSLGGNITSVLTAMQHRAPVFLRVNALKSDIDSAVAALQEDAIESEPVPGTPHALKVTANPRRVAGSKAFQSGWVELQDAASQRVVDAVTTSVAGAQVLDYCAGGGGKTLALAACRPAALVAHDVDPRRMRDLPGRLARAGAKAEVVTSAELHGLGERFDVVLADAPCSGTGSWRRDPEGKWNLNEERLAELMVMQRDALASAASFVRPGGLLVYATCSFLACENQEQAAMFAADHDAWCHDHSNQDLPSDLGDGFFAAHFKRVS